MKIKRTLNEHDRQHQGVFHQAMVLCQTIETINQLRSFVDLYNQNEQPIDQCKQYAGNVPELVKQNFIAGHFRTLVICGKLKEGFDHKNVSVLGVIRNINSNVLFAQFVGRAVRIIDQNDHLTAVVHSDPYFRPVIDRWIYYENPNVMDEDDPIE